MITLRDAERIAAVWAHRESLRRGFPCVPMVSEFDVGFVIWMREPATVLPQPGVGVCTVLDKQTGRVSTWPGLPSAVVKELYRRQRDTVVPNTFTSDPCLELRREARRRPTPSIAARITVRYRAFVGRGAKATQQLRHHPLVQAALARHAPNTLVAGVERHAELIAVSDALYTFDAEQFARDLEPLTAAATAALLAEAQLELTHIREPGDPLAGRPATSCASCAAVLAGLGMAVAAPPGPLMAPTPPTVTDSDRFPAAVLHLLASAGWVDGRAADAAEVSRRVEAVRAVTGQEHRHDIFPAAVAALTEFGGLATSTTGPGTHHWVRPIRIDPAAAAHTADLLAESGTALGARLFPLGVVGNDEALLAIDDGGRVFALDQAGEWLLGQDLDAALVTLLTGGPATLVEEASAVG